MSVPDNIAISYVKTCLTLYTLLSFFYLLSYCGICMILSLQTNMIQIMVVSVYGVEASSMAEQARLLINSNNMADRVQILHGKIEVRLDLTNTLLLK